MKFLPFLFLLIPFVILFVVVKSTANKNNNTYEYGNRMLCKSQSNRMIAGVCGGIAEYFGWNVIIVRLFFILSGIGIMTYIILSIAIPDPPSSLW